MNLKIEFQELIQEVILRNGFEVFNRKIKMNLQNGIRFKEKFIWKMKINLRIESEFEERYKFAWILASLLMKMMMKSNS